MTYAELQIHCVGIFLLLNLIIVFQVVSSGAYLLAQAESKLQNNRGLTEQDEPSAKSDRREERRKKAAGGKGGGGTQVSNTVYCITEYHIHQSNILPLMKYILHF
jgi:hypothetical protein